MKIDKFIRALEDEARELDEQAIDLMDQAKHLRIIASIYTRVDKEKPVYFHPTKTKEVKNGQ